MRDLTLVMAHYMNLGMWAEQQRIWADYPSALRARLHVIVVDDCSPKAARPSRKSVTVAGLGSLRLYRLLEKKRWNWLACRNLGAQQCQTEWMLLTDMDHAVPVLTLVRLLSDPLDPRLAYRFSRRDAPRPWPYHLDDCPPYKGHPDSYLLTRALFFDPRVGGYDERLSGCYGTSGEFKDRLESAVAVGIERRAEYLIRYPRDVIADASTPPAVFTRKNDPANEADLAQRKADRALIPDWRPLHGLVPYELVYDSQHAEVAA